MEDSQMIEVEIHGRLHTIETSWERIKKTYLPAEQIQDAENNLMANGQYSYSSHGVSISLKKI